MQLRRWAAACLPTPVKRAIRELVCGPASPAVPVGTGDSFPLARLREAPGCEIEIVPGDIISDAISATGVWEEELSARLVQIARRDGGTMVEVGANIGYFSVLWAAQGPACRVLAFEPSWRNLPLLHRNITRNGLSERVDILPVAASHSVGIVRFDPGPAEQTGWGGIVTSSHSGTVAVATVPLDALLPAEMQITVLKIDVEGADTWVLEGCRELLRSRRVARVFYEQNHPRMAALGIAPSAAQSFLASVGYRTEPLTSTTHEVVEWEAYPATD